MKNYDKKSFIKNLLNVHRGPGSTCPPPKAIGVDNWGHRRFGACYYLLHFGLKFVLKHYTIFVNFIDFFQNFLKLLKIF